MKKHVYILVLTLSLAVLASCKDDFLERAPLTSLGDVNYWKSENDLKIYINNFYNLDALLPSHPWWLSQGPYGEDAVMGSDIYCPMDYNRRMNGETVLPSSGGGWTASDWSVLRNINYFMDHYHLVNAPWDHVKQYVGEALFFRSVFYFNKLRAFGDVPWASTTVALDSDLLFSGRTPRNAVADSVLHDLDLAIEYLPVRGNGSWTGRITREAALALQARIALYEGTWEIYHRLKNTPFAVAGSDGTKFIRKAEEAAGTLIAMSETNGYPALDNVNIENGYWLLFNQKDYSNHKEVLLWRKYSNTEGVYHRWIAYTSNGGSYGITKSMIDAYLCTDGKPIAVSPLYQGDRDLKTVVVNRDPRLNQTIQVDDGKHLIWDNPELLFTTPTFEGLVDQRCATGYQLYKGHTADYAERLNGFTSTSGQIYFRYAESLLIYAEAKAVMGTITQADVDKTVNALRLRVGMNNALLKIDDITADPNWEFNGISPILQEIRRERKVELACEGFRVDDVFRWAAADELIVGKKPLGAIRRQWENYPGTSSSFLAAVKTLPVNNKGYIEPYANSLGNSGYRFRPDRDYLLPVPTTELALNPALTQNPGW